MLRFDLMVLFYMDSLSKTRSLFNIKIHEAKKTLIKDIGPVNRVHLQFWSALKTYISCVSRNYCDTSYRYLQTFDIWTGNRNKTIALVDSDFQSLVINLGANLSFTIVVFLALRY